MAEVTLTTGGKPNERGAGIVSRMDGDNRLYEATGCTHIWHAKRGILRGNRRFLADVLAQTLVAGDLFDGIVEIPALAASRVYTLPTDALFLAALGVEEITAGEASDPVSPPACSFELLVDNTSNGTYTATIAVGTNGTAKGDMVVAADTCGTFRIVFTATSGAYDVIRAS